MTYDLSSVMPTSKPPRRWLWPLTVIVAAVILAGGGVVAALVLRDGPQPAAAATTTPPAPTVVRTSSPPRDPYTQDACNAIQDVKGDGTDDPADVEAIGSTAMKSVVVDTRLSGADLYHEAILAANEIKHGSAFAGKLDLITAELHFKTDCVNWGY